MKTLTYQFRKPFVGAILITCFGFLLLISGRSSSSNLQGNQTFVRDKPRPENAYRFSDSTPAGEWMAQPDIDTVQSNDPDSPVVIAGIRSYMGKGNWKKQLMIESVVLKNHTPQTVSAVRFGWIIITEMDRNQKKNREAALVQGFTNLQYLDLPGQGIRRGIYLDIDFVKEAKPLIKHGVLTGTFFLRTRVSEVHFADGSIWKENEAGAFSKEFSHARYRGSQLPTCPNERCLFQENGQGYCETFSSSQGWICRRGEPCNPADPDACTCESSLCSQCKDLDNDGWYDCEGDCWDAANNLAAFNTHPGADEICNDGIDNDCNPTTPDGAGCASPTPTPTPTPNPTPTPTPNPTPTPPAGQNCTTAGWNGDCPPGTQPDGFGWCCADCGGFYATQAKSSGKDPTSNIMNPSCCDDWQRLQCYQGGGEWYESQCACYSPVIIDVAGNGFNLTNAANGVMFDLPGAGVAEQLSWTSVDSDDAWLALDRNGNGIIENGKELFGTFTAQPALALGESKNGFRALAMFDAPAFGGNADGQIDTRDAIFSNLRLWQDRNHNGISEAGELRSLSALDIDVIELSYKESRRKDESGNWFRYRARVRDQLGFQRGRWAWDVFLQKP